MARPLPGLAAASAAPSRLGPRRAAGGLVACGALALLGLAAWLVPSASGVGTHQQLGLLPCGWLAVFGKPCPTCGMTTAFAHAAHGDLLHAFTAQPMGAALALAASAAAWVGLHVAITGSDLGRVCGNLLRPLVLWGLAGAALLAWAYKLAVWHEA